MITIQLKDLQFFSFHGVHEEEKILGNSFVVNASVSFEESQRIKTLEQTVNYVAVYQIIKKRMELPTDLLETLAQELAELIHAFDGRINSVSVNIEKKNPPIANMEGSISVHYKKTFS